MGSRRKKPSPDEIRRRRRARRDERVEVRRRRGRLGSDGLGDHEAEQVITLTVPDLFCFLSNASTALVFIALLRENIAGPVALILTLDFSNCKVLGLGAYLLMIDCLRTGQQEKGDAPFTILAIRSHAEAVNFMLDGSDPMLARGVAKRIVSPVIWGRAVLANESIDRDRAGTEIVDYINRCLDTEGDQLTPEGQKYLGNLVTEAVGNAEEHGGPWTAAGYFVQMYGSDPGECHVVLFNHGDSIAERIEDPDSSPEVREKANALADSHRRNGYFSARSSKWTREALVTLYALQEGVSSRLHERSSRGNGTIEIIKAFSKLAGKDQSMCILSGSAYIFFDGTYVLKEKVTEDDEVREVIAFNEVGSLDLPPDERYVSVLPQKFQGTIVNVRFRLRRNSPAVGVARRSQNDQDLQSRFFSYLCGC